MRENISIHIPSPCQENWNNMTPVDKGRFCQSCAKTIIDFSVMTDSEILGHISKASGATCGRFAVNQLRRPLQPIKEEKQNAWWVAAMLPLLLFFKKAEAQSKQSTANIIKLQQDSLSDILVVGYITCRGGASDYWHVEDEYAPAKKPNMYDAHVKAIRQKGSYDFTIDGRIVDAATGTPVGLASISVTGDGVAAVTDSAGYFKLRGKTTENHCTLQVNKIGFATAEVYVRIKETDAVSQTESPVINGRLIDSATRKPVEYATVLIKGTRTGAVADDHGNFSLKPGTSPDNKILQVSAVGYEVKEIEIPTGDEHAVVNIGNVTLSATKTDLLGVVVTTVAVKKKIKKDTVPAVIRKVFSGDKFKTYPNPAPQGGNITIEIKNEGVYTIQLFDNAGHLINVKQVDAVEGNMQTMLNIPLQLNAGTYYIRLVDEKRKKQYTDKLVVM